MKNKNKALWFIAQKTIDYSEKIAVGDFIGKASFSKKGYLILYSKNTMKNYYFKNPIPLLTHYAYLAERRTCPLPFKYTIDRWYPHGRIHLSWDFIRHN